MTKILFFSILFFLSSLCVAVPYALLSRLSDPPASSSGTAIYYASDKYQDAVCARIRDAYITKPFQEWYYGTDR